MKTAWIIEAGEPNARPRLYLRRYWVAQIGDMFIQDDLGLGDGIAKLHRSPDFAKDWGSEEAAQYAIDHYRHKVPVAELAKTAAAEGSEKPNAKDYRNGYAAGQRGNYDALGKADARGVSKDWYRGFYDGDAGAPSNPLGLEGIEEPLPSWAKQSSSILDKNKCEVCDGLGHLDDDGNPTADKNAEGCLDCHQTGYSVCPQCYEPHGHCVCGEDD